MTFANHRFTFDNGDILNISAEGIKETHVAQPEHLCSLCSLFDDGKHCPLKRQCNNTHFTRIYYG